MTQYKIILPFCFLFCMASLSSCSQQPNKENINNNQVTVKKENTNNAGIANRNGGKIAIKNWNESDYRLPQKQHQQLVQNLSQQFPGTIVYKASSRLKRVALTFDDGPDNFYTPRILDILRTKGVPGTFFMVGKQAKYFPDMVRRIVYEGNAIGNHSWDHPKLWKLTNEKVIEEIVATENEIQRITGRRSDLFRPPYGRVSPAQTTMIHNLGYRIIDWSVDTVDWKGTKAPQILQNVYKEITPGGIILEHCMAGRPGELNGTLQALPQIIDQLRAQGYQFVTVPTLLGK